MSFTTKVQYDLQLWFIAIGDRKKRKKEEEEEEEEMPQRGKVEALFMKHFFLPKLRITHGG